MEFDSEAEFAAAASVARSLSGASTAERLKLYGLFKRATVGECPTGKPPLWDMSGRAKWQAWQDHSMSAEDAKFEYVQLVDSIRAAPSSGATSSDTGVRLLESSKTQQKGMGAAKKVSTLGCMDDGASGDWEAKEKLFEAVRRFQLKGSDSRPAAATWPA